MQNVPPLQPTPPRFTSNAVAIAYFCMFIFLAQRMFIFSNLFMPLENSVELFLLRFYTLINYTLYTVSRSRWQSRSSVAGYPSLPQGQSHIIISLKGLLAAQRFSKGLKVRSARIEDNVLSISTKNISKYMMKYFSRLNNRQRQIKYGTNVIHFIQLHQKDIDIAMKSIKQKCVILSTR